MDRANSRAVSSAQIVTQHPQLFTSSGMNSSMEQSLKKFYKGEPLALGITQILIGALRIAFGVVLDLVNYPSSAYILLKTPYWTGILCIISGSLSVAAARNPKMPIVKAMLGMNVVSTVASGLEIVILSISLAYSDFLWYSTSDCVDLDAKQIQKCYEYKVIPHVSAYCNIREWTVNPLRWEEEQHVLKGMMAVFLLFSILEFCTSICSAAFGCKASCQEPFAGTIVVIYQNAPPGNAVNLPVGCKDTNNP